MVYVISYYSKNFRTATTKCLYSYSQIESSKQCRSYRYIAFKGAYSYIECQYPLAPALTSHRELSDGSDALLTFSNDRKRFSDGCFHHCLDVGFTNSLQQRRKLSLSSALRKLAKDEKKVVKTVEALKTGVKPAEPPKKSLWKRIVEECAHYYHGFRLLGADIRVASRLGIRMSRGKPLTRRERQLLIRTVSDVFRLVPFSVFVFVPLAELTLPLALKLFPNMLPSTFQTKDERVQKLKNQLKVKLEVAKFLQDTLGEMSLQTKGSKNSKAAEEFKEFYTRVRQSGAQPSTQEILKFSKLFKDDLTLENLPRSHLLALCRMLELHDYGPSSFLSFQLRTALKEIKTDDILIQKEGMEKMTMEELQQALKTRGIRAVGYSEPEMRQQLNTWLDLHLKQAVPPSLLLLTRAMAVTDVMPAVDQIAATIKELPETLGAQAEASLGEMEGKVNNKVRLQILKAEEKQMIEEQKERDAVEKEQKRLGKVSVDPAAAEGITSSDLSQIQGAMDSIRRSKKKLLVEKRELQELKADVGEYQEGLQELEREKQKLQLSNKDLQESKAARRVNKQIQKMIRNMDGVIKKAEREKLGLQEEIGSGRAKQKELVSITELLSVMKKLQKTPDNERMKKIENVLAKMDVDQDGNLSTKELLKVFELLGPETSNVTPEQMKEIVEMIGKERALKKGRK